MGETVRRTIVVSAVNIRKGGTLTILRQCLEYLSGKTDEYRIVALVHDRRLCEYPGIEYIEMKWCVRSWFARLWAEYVTMHKISLDIAAQDGGRKVWLWLSMHDTTPRVEAERQEVYCHTSFPFMKLIPNDFLMDPKIPLFAMFTKWAYRINVHKNDSLIVQQNWFADALSKMVGVSGEKFRVIPPSSPQAINPIERKEKNDIPVFFYASTPDCHKNFETLCRAAEYLEKEAGEGKFKVIITVRGNENRYARYLFRHWGKCRSIDFHGLMSKDELFETYASADCFVFPSRVETWGLPISEYLSVQPEGRILLADLPYARETSAGRGTYFPVRDWRKLSLCMKEIIC